LSDWKEELLRNTTLRYNEGNWIVSERRIDDITKCLQKTPPFSDIPRFRLSLDEIKKGIVLLYIEDKEFIPHESLKILREFNNELKKNSRDSSEFDVRKYPDVNDFSLIIAIHIRPPSRKVRDENLVLHITEVSQIELTFWEVYEYVKHVWQDIIINDLENWNKRRLQGNRFR